MVGIKKKIVVLFCISVIVILFVLENRFEASVPVRPMPWEVVFEEVNTIFFMTPAQIPSQEQLDWFRVPEISEERMQIRTGLYCLTSMENVYYVDINALRGSVIFSNCGRYFVAMQHTVDNFNGEYLGGGLINFFSNGILIKSYGVECLIRNEENLPWTTAGTFWMLEGSRAFNQELNFNPQTNALTISTTDNGTFVFDITTGDIISRTGRIRALITFLFSQTWFAYIIVIVIFITLAITFLVNRRKKVSFTK